MTNSLSLFELQEEEFQVYQQKQLDLETDLQLKNYQTKEENYNFHLKIRLP